MISNIDLARERYHIAKLSLFNVRLLAALQQDKGKEINALVTYEASANGFKVMPSLLHQGTFLQFAYVCLVWLWESAKLAGLEHELLEEFPKVTERYGVKFPSPEQIQGNRNLYYWKDVLKLLRNALSHGKVDINEDVFLFFDQNTRSRTPEPERTTLSLSWEQLAKISESCIHALTPALYNGTKK
ncbi:MAG: hypothetical protein KGZ75_02430 [Syntrophomonadaceae bacterium]|nr:hypothetical protein [Syntrophomonadaceae bacterium]